MSEPHLPWVIKEGTDNADRAEWVWGSIVDDAGVYIARIWGDCPGGIEQAATNAALIIRAVSAYTGVAPKVADEVPTLQDVLEATKVHFDALCEVDDPKLYDIVEGMEISISKLETVIRSLGGKPRRA